MTIKMHGAFKFTVNDWKVNTRLEHYTPVYV